MRWQSMCWGICLGVALCCCSAAAQDELRLSVKEYRDKMKAGWIGQIAGVSWGAPTEFKWQDQIIPADKMPVWRPAMINDAFGQDDLYVEMTFLRSLEQYGHRRVDPPGGHRLRQQRLSALVREQRRTHQPAQRHRAARLEPSAVQQMPERHRLPDRGRLLGPDRARHAAGGHRSGREVRAADELRRRHVCRPVHGRAVRRGVLRERSGQARRERRSRPFRPDSQYAEMVRDLVAWYRADPNDWEATWQKCQKKYRENPEYQKASNGGIDCKINGAYVLMGLLFGKRDLDQTILISCRSGMDSDCNPSSSAGVLFTTIGLQQAARRGSTPAWTRSGVQPHRLQLPAPAGRVREAGAPVPGATRRARGKRRERRGSLCHPGEDAQAEQARAELGAGPDRQQPVHAGGDGADHRRHPAARSKQAVPKFAPGLEGQELRPGHGPRSARRMGRARRTCLCTHPLDRETGCVLSRTIEVPPGRRPRCTWWSAMIRRATST